MGTPTERACAFCGGSARRGDIRTRGEPLRWGQRGVLGGGRLIYSSLIAFLGLGGVGCVCETLNIVHAVERVARGFVVVSYTAGSKKDNIYSVHKRSSLKGPLMKCTNRKGGLICVMGYV